jgi:hypothetical protein
LPSVKSAEAVWLVTARLKERDSIEPAIEYLEWNGISRVRHYDVLTVRYVLPVGCCPTPRRLAAQGSSSWTIHLGGAIREALSAMMMPLLPMH